MPSAPAHTEAVMPGSSYPKDFEEFWSIYPRKVDKGNAYKKYKARINDGWKESELMEAASNYAEQVKRDRTEAKYIKHPKTFLSETTPFQDYLSGKDPAASASGTDEEHLFDDWR